MFQREAERMKRYKGDPCTSGFGQIPNEVTVEDKSLMEQVKLIAELEPEEKNMVFKMIDTFLTKKKFKDFFAKNSCSQHEPSQPLSHPH